VSGLFFLPQKTNTLTQYLYLILSYGTDTVNSTEATAPPVWKALQLLFESGQFAKYLSRELVCVLMKNKRLTWSPRLIIAGESYAGHYIPDFITYFDEQNTKISQDAMKGEKIEITAFMINK
jgi:hypothetical protein